MGRLYVSSFGSGHSSGLAREAAEQRAMEAFQERKVRMKEESTQAWLKMLEGVGMVDPSHLYMKSEIPEGYFEASKDPWEYDRMMMSGCWDACQQLGIRVFVKAWCETLVLTPSGAFSLSNTSRAALCDAHGFKREDFVRE